MVSSSVQMSGRQINPLFTTEILMLVPRLIFPFFLAITGLFWWSQMLTASPTSAGTPLDRPHEAIVLPGAAFADWLGIPLEELALYRYHQDGWEPVLFQLDEVDELGSYVAPGDGLLGAADELVFMAVDSGDWITPTFWISDSHALLHPRHVITITDPLDGAASGWVYLYRSSTLPRAGHSYVSWDETTQTITGVAYSLAFTPDQFLGIAAIYLNDQPQDVLDRQKLRAEATVYALGFPFDTITINEEEILDYLAEPVSLTLPITGPVRAIGKSGVQQVAFYGRQAHIEVALPVSEQPVPGLPGATARLTSLRLSLDLADPLASGLAPATYYDSNLVTGVAVDGMPDSVPSQPLVNWQQIDGAAGGFVSLLHVAVTSGQTATFYRDDSAFDPNDTGDGRSYGDAGFRVTNPDGLLEVNSRLYFLPGQQGRQGEQIAAQAANPLQSSIGRQLPPGPPDPPSPGLRLLYLPLISSGG
jgi:hypothetical protein